MKPENWEEGSKKSNEVSKPKDSPPFAYGAYLQDQRVAPIIEACEEETRGCDEGPILAIESQTIAKEHRFRKIPA
jgi:hypothetical protein